MKDFDKYFYEKFCVYQTYENPLMPTIYIHNTDNAVDFEMHDNNKLIDTIYVWRDDKRLITKSMNGRNYSISNDIDLREIIEKEIEYIL